MKKLLLLLAVVGTTIYSSAQTLPKPSPQAEVEQQVGATEIEIKYSRPGVKQRDIFGGLVQYDKLWRFGANSATTISFDHSLFFNGQELKAGTYSILVIPGKESWKVMFNTDTDASEESYKAEKTVLTVEGKVSKNPFTESFFIGFDNIKDESASIISMWEETKVEIPFTVKTKENSLRNIEEAIKEGEDLKSVYNNAANYFYGSLKDYKGALKYVDQSISLDENFGNLFLKSRILYELGEKKEAQSIGAKSVKMAEKDASIGYYNFIKATVDKWSK